MATKKFACCVRGCDSGENTALHYFPHPTDKEKFRKWLSLCGNVKLLKLKPASVHASKRICTNHFEAACVSGRSGKLSKFAAPTRNLPDPIPLEIISVTSAATSLEVTTPEREKTTLETPYSAEPFWKDITSPTYEYTAVVPIKRMSENSVMDVVVREAIREDMHEVCRLIKALAKFEKLEDQVKINPETLMNDGFDTNFPAFKCFIAELHDGSIIGYAIYYTCYSTWLGKSIFLEDLYVDPAYRKHGVGKALLLSVAKVAHETNKRLDFHVLSWNPAVEFYKSLGAINLTNSEQWQLFRLDENSLNRLLEN